MRRIGLVFVLLAAGCGSTSSPPAAPMARADYVREVNAICKRNLAEVRRITTETLDRAEARGWSSNAAAAAVIHDTLPTLSRSLRRASAVRPPGADAGRLRAFWARADDSVALLRHAGDAYRDADARALRSLRRRLLAIATDTRPFARDYGLSACLPD